MLDDYFTPKINEQLEIYKFRQYKQRDDQTLDEYVTELRRLAKYCKFGDTYKEILSQLIQNCKSNRLRRRALREPDKKLDDILNMGRTLEISDSQASAMEKSETVNTVNKKTHIQTSKPTNYKSKSVPHERQNRHKPRKYVKPQQDKNITCRKSGGGFQHEGQCPAKGRRCNFCKKQNLFQQVCRKKLESVKEINPEGACAIQNRSSSDEDSDYCDSIKTKQHVGTIGKKTPKVTVKINGVNCNMLVDTGASVNIQDNKTYQKIGSPKLQKKIFPHFIRMEAISHLK